MQAAPRRTIESIDSELRSVAAVRHATREMGESLPLTDVVDSLLDERLRARQVGYTPRAFSPFPKSA
ncbi:hypothetical protein A5641_22420 [Mycobacterium sp. 1554424.7]|nr:hypothetical protein A5641_22420 [Mycobacterium sp. 1554424.7]